MGKTAQAEACVTVRSATAFFRGSNEVRSEMEGAHKSFEGHIVVGFRFANFRGENKTQFAGACFFVGMHGGDKRFRWNAGPRGKRTHSTDQRNNARNLIGWGEADFVAEKSGGHHAPGNGFAVLVGAVICDGFEGVAEGVAEI